LIGRIGLVDAVGDSPSDPFEPIGVLKMTDEGGGDEKIVAVPIPKLTQRYAHVRNYTDLPEITWRQIEHFFAHYKDLEGGKWVTFAHKL
jgi:inorganic pyrophosphatase